MIEVRINDNYNRFHCNDRHDTENNYDAWYENCKECLQVARFNLTLCKKCEQKIYWIHCNDRFHKEARKYRKYTIDGRCTEPNWCPPGNISLELNERGVTFKDYDLILCEECNQKVHSTFFIYEDRDKEINNEEKKHMKCGRWFQIRTNDYGCKSCNSKRFRKEFDKWTSGNKHIDELIRDSQLSAEYNYELLEWISYDRFTDINYIDEGGFAKVYSATWKDGNIKNWNRKSNDWEREGSFKVALKVLNNSKNISEDFLNEVKSLKLLSKLNFGIIEFYGITRVPETLNYALVFKLKDSNLRFYLNQNCNSLTWERRLYIIECICLGLYTIHHYGLIHKDLHIGNILQSNDYSEDLHIGNILQSNDYSDDTEEIQSLEKKAEEAHRQSKNLSLYPCISDFGFCKPANENSSKSNIYGVMAYMAPEIIRGYEYTQASDMYSLGIIINEIISIIPPFNKEPHDYYLALDICRGKRPKIMEETPEFLKKLIKSCWDANPKNRPSSDEVYTTLVDFKYTKVEKGAYNFNMYTEQYEELIESTCNFIEPTTNSSSRIQSFNTHPQVTYTSRLLNFPNLPEPVNCPNQEEFVSSRKIIVQGQAEDAISECLDCKITR